MFVIAIFYTLIFEIVRIPDSVTWIGSWAFEGCAGLTSVTIPESVTTIGSNAFSNCGKNPDGFFYVRGRKWSQAERFVLREFISTNEMLKFIGTDEGLEISGDFEYSLNPNNTVTLVRYLGKETQLVLPENINGRAVSAIAVSAFANAPKGPDGRFRLIVAEGGLLETAAANLPAVEAAPAPKLHIFDAGNNLSAVKLKRYMLGLDKFYYVGGETDINGDGKIDVADLVCLKRALAGWEGYHF